MKKTSKKKTKDIFGLKKPLFILSCIFTCILLIMLGLWIAAKNTSDSYKTINNSQNSLNITSGKVVYTEGDENTLPTLTKVDDSGQPIDDFKISVVGDLHMSPNEYDTQIRMIESIMKKEKPDLLVLNGDISWGEESDVVSKKLNEMFEKNNQYWTFNLGNHDGESWSGERYQARRNVFNAYCGITKEHPQPSKHCLARTRTNNVQTCGSGTNCINIVGKENKVLHSLFFFDCNTIQEQNQEIIDWYKQTLLLTDGANSTAITHIPFVEFDYAYKNINKNPDVKYYYGCNEETICTLNNKNGLFEEFINNGQTKSIIYSHDHVNNTSLEYKGIRMSYSLTLAFTCYTRRDRFLGSLWNNISYMIDDSLCNYVDGFTNVYINKDKYEIGCAYANFNGGFDGLEFDLYKYTFAITYGHWLTILNRIIFPLLSCGCIVYWVLFTRHHIKLKKANKHD